MQKKTVETESARKKEAQYEAVTTERVGENPKLSSAGEKGV